MALVTLPHNLVAGALAKAAEVMANLNAILTQAVNGNLADVNINPAAAIQGSKLSNVPGSRVPTDRIEDIAVTDIKLRSDATVDANRAVTTDHIRDAAVVKAKVAAAAISYNKLDVLTQEVTFSLNFPSDGSSAVVATLLFRKVVGADYVARVGAYSDIGETAGADVTPGTAIPVATKNLIGLYLADVVVNSAPSPNKFEGKVVFISISKT